MSSTPISRRGRLVLARWLSLMTYGFIGALVGFLIEDALRPFDRISARLEYLPPTIGLAATLAVVSFLSWRLGRGRWRGLLGLNKYFLSYPPLWVAFIFAGMASGCMAILEPGLQETSEALKTQVANVWWYLGEVRLWFWLVIVALPLVSIFAVGFIERARTARPKPRSRENQQDISSQLRELIEWMRDDGEIKHPDSDYFKHDVVAQRIVRRLTKAFDDAPTMAVVGPYGSGKSSICNLVAHRLKDERRIHLVRVSLWPFDSSEAAVAGILSKVIRTLGQHVNTLSLTGLAAQYVSIIEGVGGRWGVFARLLRPSFSPEEILKRISTVATASGMRLVLWIEDLERFSARDTSGEIPVTERQSERLAPIHSLLHLLDRCPSISVIVADTSLETRIDIGKIARYVERPPRPEPEDVWDKATTLRRECRGGYPREVLHPASKEHQRMLAPADNEITEYSQYHYEHKSGPHVKAAFVELLDTPRAFKTALRLTWETWKTLAGEIDFDDVLIASALREAQPKVFDYIERNIGSLRSSFGKEGSTRDDNPVLKELDDLLNLETDTRKKVSIRTLLHYLFPMLDYDLICDTEDVFVERPQALCNDRHTDYWRRYQTLQDVSVAESDQGALESIKAWKKGEPSNLIHRLLDPKRAAQIQAFVDRFDMSDLCRLLPELAHTLSDKSVRTWNDGLDVPGLVPLWHMMHHKRPREEVLAETLQRLIRDLVPTHLHLVVTIRELFTRGGGDVPSLLSGQVYRDVMTALIDALRATYKPGSGQRLLDAAGDGSPDVVYWVSLNLNNLDADKKTDLPFDGWEPFAECLLHAAELDPARGLPLFLGFVVSGKDVTGHRTVEETGLPEPFHSVEYSFNGEVAQRLFDFDRLLGLFAAEGKAPEHLDEANREKFEIVVKAAKAHLDTYQSEKPDAAEVVIVSDVADPKESTDA